MGLIVTLPPTADWISTTQAKLHLRVDSTADDVLIDRLIAAARQYAQSYTRRQLVTATYRLTMDAFPSTIIIPRNPLVSVSSITYLDTAGAVQTLAAATYTVDKYAEPATIYLAYAQSWPTTYGVPNAVSVYFHAGYATQFTATNATNLMTPTPMAYVDSDVVQIFTHDTVPTGWEVDKNYYVVTAGATTMQLSLTALGAPVAITTDGTPPHFVGNEVPPAITTAMLLMMAHWYEHREAVSDFQLGGKVQFAVESLLSPYRLLEADS